MSRFQCLVPLLEDSNVRQVIFNSKRHHSNNYLSIVDCGQLKPIQAELFYKTIQLFF